MKDNRVRLLPSSRTGWNRPRNPKCSALPWLMILFMMNLATVLYGKYLPLMAQEPSKGMPKVSFETKDAPLRNLINQYLDPTGYKVKGWESWGDVRVTVKVEGTPLDEALRTILKKAGVNHFVMKIDESERLITLRRLGKSGDSASRPGETREVDQVPVGRESVFAPLPENKGMRVPTDRDETLGTAGPPPPDPDEDISSMRELQGGSGKALGSKKTAVTSTGKSEGKVPTSAESDGIAE